MDNATRKAEPAPVEGPAWNAATLDLDTIDAMVERAEKIGMPVNDWVAMILKDAAHRVLEIAEPDCNASHVTLPRMSEETALSMIETVARAERESPVAERVMIILRHLNLIADPTPLDRFAAAHPEIDLGDEAVRAGIEAAGKWEWK